MNFKKQICAASKIYVEVEAVLNLIYYRMRIITHRMRISLAETINAIKRNLYLIFSMLMCSLHHFPSVQEQKRTYICFKKKDLRKTTLYWQ